MHKKKEVIRRESGYSVIVLGGKPPGLRDLYHALLRIPWWGAFLVIVGGYFALNACFAALYLWSGGIANAQPGSYADAFFFSVQTMGTIGYGAMYPTTRFANWLVVFESVTGLVVTALATGLVFVRFSQTRPRVMFSKNAAISPQNGVPTLMFRVGNERRNLIVDSIFRLTLTRTTHTAEGVTIYRSEDLALVRDRAPALTRSWMVMHRIEPGSPLHGETAESLAACDAEVTAQLVGTDDTSLQPVHSSHTWMANEIIFGSRLADVVSETPDGNIVLDLNRFHDLEKVSS
jgi:inward rectifier potassium channel